REQLGSRRRRLQRLVADRRPFRGRANARCVARSGRRARRRADGDIDGRERSPHAAAVARARCPRGGGRVCAAASPPDPAALRPSVPCRRRGGALPGAAPPPAPPRGGLGARRPAVRTSSAPLGPRRACPEAAVSDTVVFIPAWNEDENLPAVLD